jgi:hypothetical protein
MALTILAATDRIEPEADKQFRKPRGPKAADSCDPVPRPRDLDEPYRIKPSRSSVGQARLRAKEGAVRRNMAMPFMELLDGRGLRQPRPTTAGQAQAEVEQKAHRPKEPAAQHITCIIYADGRPNSPGYVPAETSIVVGFEGHRGMGVTAEWRIPTRRREQYRALEDAFFSKLRCR